MIKYIVVILFLFSSIQNLFCQNTITDSTKYQVIYNFEYQMDSSDVSSKNSTEMVLMLGKKYSLFQSVNLKYNDSLKKAIVNSGADISSGISQLISARKGNRFNYKILKSTEQTLVYDHYFSNKFIYKDEERINWTLTTEKANISGYNCTKALTSFAGRNYTAWFTQEIPINDGPYKFKGLPGLIVKIEDSQAHYTFSLISFETSEGIIEFDLKAGKEITKKEFFESYNKFKKNFINELSNSGVELDKSTSRQTQQRVQKSRNNEIELSY